jgi:hypothetical protein
MDIIGPPQRGNHPAGHGHWQRNAVAPVRNEGVVIAFEDGRRRHLNRYPDSFPLHVLY